MYSNLKLVNRTSIFEQNYSVKVVARIQRSANIITNAMKSLFLVNCLFMNISPLPRYSNLRFIVSTPHKRRFLHWTVKNFSHEQALFFEHLSLLSVFGNECTHPLKCNVTHLSKYRSSLASYAYSLIYCFSFAIHYKMYGPYEKWCANCYFWRVCL